MKTKLNKITPALRQTMKAMSDHQILGFVDVMFAGDHSIDDATATYVAAYMEAMDRPIVKSIIELGEQS